MEMVMKTEKEARALALKVEKLLGKKWKSQIWENLGWYVEWINGAVCLSWSSWDERFWCRVGEPESGEGHLDFHEVGKRSKNPKVAIKSAIKDAKKVIEEEWIPIIHSLNEITVELEK